MDSLKNSKNRQKVAKNRDFESSFQANYITYKQNFDVCRKNSLKYALKTSKIANFYLPTVEKRSRDSSLGQLEAYIFFEFRQWNFNCMAKKHMHKICWYFSRKNPATGGVNTPQIPLTVNNFWKICLRFFITHGAGQLPNYVCIWLDFKKWTRRSM